MTGAQNNSANIRCRGHSTKTTTVEASRANIIWITLFFVFLTLPLASDAFGFGFGGSDGDVVGSDDTTDGGSAKQMTKRRIADKKFKFHKIERVYVDDYVEDDNDAATTTNPEANGVDDDDDEISQRNQDKEFQFERAHKALKQRQANKNIRSKEAKSNINAGETTNEDESESSSFLSSIFGSLFSNRNGKNVDSDEDGSGSAEQQSNNIIDWLKWLSEKAGRVKPAPVVTATTNDALTSWLSYLNRWPFNSFFPIGQPAKPIRMPRRGRHGKSESDDDTDSATSAEQPMSQEHFESLLHTLPGFVANASYVDNIECRQQLQVFHRQLRGHKLWTMQMLDATGKITSGILRGNINQFGDFDLCTQVRAVVKVTPEVPMRIRGKYCLAHIETQTDVTALKLPVYLAHGRGLWNSHLDNPSHFVPRYAVANWGVCIPHACSASIVKIMLETNLRPYNNTGVEFHIEVDENDCYMRQSKKFVKLLRKNTKFGVGILYIAGLGLLGLIALIYEHWGLVTILKQRFGKHSETTQLESSGDHESKAELTVENTSAPQTAVECDVASENMSCKLLALKVLGAFSPKLTLFTLLSKERPDMEFPLLHVLKLGATFMLYVCFKYVMIGHLPITNRDHLVRTVDQPLSILFRAPLIYTDILLLISGFLSAYQLSDEMEQKTYIQLLKRMASKITKYLPTVYVVLFFQTWILPHLGAGPLWTNLIGQNAQLCEEQMWRNAFSAQNAIDFEETCSPLTLQLAVDVQLYLLGPLIVWLFYTDADAGFFAYGAFHAMSVAARYSRTNREHLSMTLFHGMNISKFYRTANMIFASPICRATPYLLGIGAGILYRTEQGVLDVSTEMSIFGWLLAISSISWCFWSPAAGMRTDFIYTSGDAAAYAAWSPLILGLAVCWCIFMFPKSDNSVLRFLTTSRPILILSRIAFPMQLVAYVVVVWNTASVKESIKYHITDLVNFQEIGTIVFFGALLAFLIDIPAQQIRHLLIERIFVERPQQEQEPLSGTEPSEEGDTAEETTNERAESKTPEPAEMIWASDPEEEERNYIARRRSSVPTPLDSADKSSVEEEEELEDDREGEETEEVKKRPETPPPQPAKTSTTTPYTRRRRPTSDD